MIQNSRWLYRFAALGLCGLIPTIVAVVDVPTKPAQIISGHTDPVYGLAFTADGKQLVSGAFDKTIRVWDVATGKESAKLEGHTQISSFPSPSAPTEKRFFQVRSISPSGSGISQAPSQSSHLLLQQNPLSPQKKPKPSRQMPKKRPPNLLIQP